MPDSTVEERPAASARDQWRERIAEQARSGLSIKQFCKDRGIADQVLWQDAQRSFAPIASCASVGAPKSPNRPSLLGADGRLDAGLETVEDW
jgi:hypothetical protein